MDEEIKEVGEMATIEDEEDIAIEEDYTALEAETIIVDDDSNIQTDAKYEQAVEQRELADEAREALSAVLLSVLEKGEINDDDIAEIAAQQEIYTENVTALKILGLETEDEKSAAGKGTTGRNTTDVISTNINYDEILKVVSENNDLFYTDEDGNLLINGMSIPALTMVVNKLNLIASGGEDGYSSLSLTPEFIETVVAQTGNAGIKDVLTKYYLSTSATELIGGDWLDNLPSSAEQSGKYLWYKLVTIYNDHDKTPTETDPVCISSEPGKDGADGKDGEDGVDGYTIITTNETIIFKEV